MPHADTAPKKHTNGLQPHEIAALPVFKFAERHRSTTNEDSRQCLICIGEFEIDELVRLLPCMHRYHKACIDAWLLRSDECPACKHPAR